MNAAKLSIRAVLWLNSFCKCYYGNLQRFNTLSVDRVNKILVLTRHITVGKEISLHKLKRKLQTVKSGITKGRVVQQWTMHNVGNFHDKYKSNHLTSEKLLQFTRFARNYIGMSSQNNSFVKADFTRHISLIFSLKHVV